LFLIPPPLSLGKFPYFLSLLPSPYKKGNGKREKRREKKEKREKGKRREKMEKRKVK